MHRSAFNIIDEFYKTSLIAFGTLSGILKKGTFI